ncbi:MAG: hypothetical protein GHCLOJNM_01550 [bacterium]|nr:hypothetical protein [bacterium]
MEDEARDDRPCVFSYTRRQALEDGVLVDVSELAREAGFKLPVAVTSEVWWGHVARAAPPESESGRLWDLLNVLRMLIRALPDGSRADRLEFRVRFGEEDVDLWALVGPGDRIDEPVLTIMVVGED